MSDEFHLGGEPWEWWETLAMIALFVVLLPVLAYRKRRGQM